MIFASLAGAHKRVLVQNVRDFPQTKLDSEINVPFLLNEHGDPHFLFYYFNEDNILHNWEENYQKSMATFLANEILEISLEQEDRKEHLKTPSQTCTMIYQPALVLFQITVIMLRKVPES